MKKKILLVILIIIIVAVIGTMYITDRNRMKNNEPVIFSTWGSKYAPPASIKKSEEIINETGENKFIGTVLEETTTYMLVEPNEDEAERKSSDKIIINYKTDHIDYLYGVGRKVLISYNGYIKETYPAQIDSNNISVNGYEDFEITVVEAENQVTKKVLNNQELYKNNSNFDLYYYNLSDVNVKVDGKTMTLEDALRSGKITLDGIVSKANADFPDNIYHYDDGGSEEYHYENYTIIKLHKLTGNRDVYIAKKGTSLINLNIE